jgi:uncharacterized membrane protein YiaA
MPAHASNMCLFTQYFQRTFFGAPWTDARAQESHACQLWSVRIVVHRLGAWGVGVLSMPARASNMYLFTQYFQRIFFGAFLTDAHAQESRACQLWPVRMVVHRLGTWGVGILNMPVRASNMCLFTQYFQRTLFGAPWTDTRAQESRACQLWSVRTMVHSLWAWCVGVLTMPARASNMCLFTQYFQRTFFGASWTDAHAQEHGACQLWSVQAVVHTPCVPCVGVFAMPACASNMCLCILYFLNALFCASWTHTRMQE